MENTTKLARMFKALGNPNRFQLFIEIMNEGNRSFESEHTCFLHTIMERINVGAPTISHHLKELVNADLIHTERKGKYLQCQVNRDALHAIREFFTAPEEPS